MKHKNFEFKAKVNNLKYYEEKLKTLNPKFIGTDKQTDTYFNATRGRLKVREGNIENTLIFYERVNTARAKLSNVLLYKYNLDPALKTILYMQLGIKVVVQKVRNIYFIQNVKFHFDSVDSLGEFVEVEAIDKEEDFSVEQLKEQCNKYFIFFELTEDMLIDRSYSDLLIEKKSEK